LTQAVDSNLVLLYEDIPQLMLSNEFIPVAVITAICVRLRVFWNLCTVSY